MATSRIKRFQSWGTPPLVIAAGVALGLLGLVSAHGLHSSATAYHAQAQHVEHKALGLKKQIQGGAIAQQQAQPLGIVIPMTLADFRRFATLHGIQVGRVSVAGTPGLDATGQRSFQSTAEPSRAEGLKKTAVIISGNWETLGALQAALRHLQTGPVRITGLNLGQNAFRLQLAIFGR